MGCGEATVINGPVNITVNLEEDIFMPTLRGSGSAISNMNASNLAFGHVNSTLIYGNTLSNINASNIFGTLSVPFINCSSLNSVNVLATGSIGFATITGTGGTANQLTSRDTGVTINKPCGQITLFSTTILTQTTNTFTLTNSYINASDYVLVNHITGQTPGSYTIAVHPNAGSADITMRNVTTATLTADAPVIQFVVIKSTTL